MGLSPSMGTNMLPGSGVAAATASLTNSEPMPSRRPSGPISAAPPYPGWGGAVNMAFSSRYSQYPAKGRRDTTRAGVTGRAPSWLMARATSPSASAAESPNATGLMPSGLSARSSPKPVLWSYPTTVAGTALPSGVRTSAAFASRIR